MTLREHHLFFADARFSVSHPTGNAGAGAGAGASSEGGVGGAGGVGVPPSTPLHIDEELLDPAASRRWLSGTLDGSPQSHVRLTAVGVAGDVFHGAIHTAGEGAYVIEALDAGVMVVYHEDSVEHAPHAASQAVNKQTNIPHWHSVLDFPGLPTRTPCGTACAGRASM